MTHNTSKARRHITSGGSNGHARQLQGQHAPSDAPFPLTDVGNGQRFVAAHGVDVRYCHPLRCWFVWDGCRWRRDDTGEVMRRGKATVRGMYNRESAALAKLGDDDADDADRGASVARVRKAIDFARKSEHARALSRMIEMARSESGVPILPGDLDQDPWLFNCPNGTIDLRTGKLQAARREDYLTTLCPVRYDPGATCPVFTHAVHVMMAGDGEMVGYIQRQLGYALTGLVTEQQLPVWVGDGSNGKTSLLNAVLDTMGSDYAGMAPSELLLETRNEQHPTMMADLCGKRFMVASETEEGKRLNESRLKLLTGGERVKARKMKENFSEFKPTHKLLLETNHKPKVRGTDHAVWRRIRLVLFAVKFIDPNDPEAEGQTIPEHLRIDRQLPAKLDAERPGILAWLVRGCLAWQRDGMGYPAAVQAATAAYRSAEDVVGAFIAERCTLADHDTRVRASVLYGAYKEWAKAAGERPLSKTSFGEAMSDRSGIERGKSSSIVYHGIALRSVADQS